ncbi:MAG: hypothetical protein EOO01_27215, partial [Chitinophagaceae bacterium]
MKKVLFISYDGMTDPLGQSQVIPYLKGLSQAGYKISILSFEKPVRLEKNRSQIQSLLDAAGINWHPLLFTRKPPILSKIYDKWQMKSTAKKLHRKEGFDLIHCRSYVSAEAGVMLSKKFNVPFLFDMRGFWVDERVDNGQWNQKKLIYRMAYRSYKKKEITFLHSPDHIISLTENGKEELVTNKGVAADKITVIPCCVDLAHFDYHKIDPVAADALRATLGIQHGTPVLTYLGSLGGWYLTDEMLHFFKKMKEKYASAKFLFITQDAPASILALAEKWKIDPADIIVRPASRNEVPLYLSLSDWSIFFIKDAYSKKASSPTKQGEIMAMGVPLICNAIGDTGFIVTQTGAGVVVDGFTNESYDTAINEMDRLRNLRKEELRDVFELATVVVGRAGAGTVTELCALGKAALYIPLVPTGGDEQTQQLRHL